jgi:bacterial/archaeal transporter family-2 protein
MRPPPTGAALVAAVGAGGLVGLQTRINGELGTRMHSALEAAAASFVVGLAIVTCVAAFRRAGFARLRRASVVPWWWFGGLGGAFLVATAAHAVPDIGVALVSVCLVAGTTTGALFTDQFGLGPSGRHAATFWRFAGVAVVIVAVAIGAIGESAASFQPVLFGLLFVAGAASAVQQAANGQLRMAADDVIVAVFVNFVVGTAALMIVVVASGEFSISSWPHTPWLYLGGPLGLIYILVGAATVKALGVLRFVLAAVAGQLLASIVIDAAWPEPGTTLRVATVVGAVVTIVGVWLSGRDEADAPGEPVST